MSQAYNIPPFIRSRHEAIQRFRHLRKVEQQYSINDIRRSEIRLEKNSLRILFNL